MNAATWFSCVEHKVAIAIVWGTLLLLPACQIPKLSHPYPGPGLPGEFKKATGPDAPTALAAVVGGLAIASPTPESNSTENSAQLGIEQFYNDPVLTHLIHQALDSNRELKILDQEIQIASNEVLARRGAYLPFVGFNPGAGLDKSSLFSRNGAVDSGLNIAPGQAIPNPLGTYGAGVNVFWQVDIWRQLRNARDAAQRRFFASLEKRNYFVTRLVAEIAENYFNLMALDRRFATLDYIIELQEQSRKVAVAKKEAARGTELPVQRFQAEVRKNQSEKLIIRQEIIEVENRINFLLNRFPEPVERSSAGFLDMDIHALDVGVPSQLLANRPDIRQAERELAATGLDVKVARARFFPTVTLTGGVGYEAFNLRYFFNPEAIAANVVGNLTAPLINKRAIQADYLTANARQLEAAYNYQRVILNAFTEVVNRVSKAENYRRSLEIKRQQLEALDASVDLSTKLLQNASPGVDYLDVLFAQRDLRDAQVIVIDTKKQQLIAIVNAYQALGGGDLLPPPVIQQPPHVHWWWK